MTVERVFQIAVSHGLRHANFAVAPWLRVTADGHVIRPARSNRDTAIVGGLSAQVVF